MEDAVASGLKSTPHTNTLKPPPGTASSPTPSKRDNPENGHSDDIASKRSAINHGFPSQIGSKTNIFSDTSMELEVSYSENQDKHDSISEEQFQQYVDQRRAFGVQARREVASDRYPLRDLNTLSKVEWDTIQGVVNDRFRQLLMQAFPENHFLMNSIYLHRKLSDKKPP